MYKTSAFAFIVVTVRAPVIVWIITEYVAQRIRCCRQMDIANEGPRGALAWRIYMKVGLLLFDVIIGRLVMISLHCKQGRAGQGRAGRGMVRKVRKPKPRRALGKNWDGNVSVLF